LGVFNALLNTFRGESVRIYAFLLFIALPESATASIAPRVEIAILGHTEGVVVATLGTDDFLVKQRFHQGKFALIPLVAMAEPPITVETC
jgi:hypothetical protein